MQKFLSLLKEAFNKAKVIFLAIIPVVIFSCQAKKPKEQQVKEDIKATKKEIKENKKDLKADQEALKKETKDVLEAKENLETTISETKDIIKQNLEDKATRDTIAKEFFPNL